MNPHYIAFEELSGLVATSLKISDPRQDLLCGHGSLYQQVIHLDRFYFKMIVKIDLSEGDLCFIYQ
jgi:hypothetical protein